MNREEWSRKTLHRAIPLHAIYDLNSFQLLQGKGKRGSVELLLGRIVTVSVPQ
jgi:hypothetical protein